MNRTPGHVGRRNWLMAAGAIVVTSLAGALPAANDQDAHAVAPDCAQ